MLETSSVNYIKVEVIMPINKKHKAVIAPITASAKRKRLQRKNETIEQRNERLEKSRLCCEKIRATETISQRKLRLERDRIIRAKRIASKKSIQKRLLRDKVFREIQIRQQSENIKEESKDKDS
ncbi:unnamed protein product, partial [Brenthis ino]